MEIYKRHFHSSMVLMICKIFLPPLANISDYRYINARRVSLSNGEMRFFILGFRNIKDASEYKWSHCEQMEATWLRRLKRI